MTYKVIYEDLNVPLSPHYCLPAALQGLKQEKDYLSSEYFIRDWIQAILHPWCVLCHQAISKIHSPGPHLEWSVPVWFFPTEVELPSNWESHKKPIAEAEVVNKLEDIFYDQVYQAHRTLVGKVTGMTWKILRKLCHLLKIVNLSWLLAWKKL